MVDSCSMWFENNEIDAPLFTIIGHVIWFDCWTMQNHALPLCSRYGCAISCGLIGNPWEYLSWEYVCMIMGIILWFEWWLSLWICSLLYWSGMELYLSRECRRYEFGINCLENVLKISLESPSCFDETTLVHIKYPEQEISTVLGCCF